MADNHLVALDTISADQSISNSGSTSSESESEFSSALSKYTGKNLGGGISTTDLSSVYTLSEIFKEASEKYGVDQNLLECMAKQESGFNPTAVSSAGATGIMQLMPQTAAGLGVTDSTDPYQNIMAGAEYIAKKLDEFGGDVKLALAAYNAGSGAVNQYGGIPPYAETQNYVANITSMMERGVEVPDDIYYAKDADREDILSDIETLIGGMSSLSSYSRFSNLLASNSANYEFSAEDPQDAYEKLLNATNSSVLQMLEQIS